MKIAVVGGGIIGACSAWALAKRHHEVCLFEQDSPMAHTSQSSSKLLHGGLRYLETGQFALVKKALQARRFWLEQAPQLCHQLELFFPIYKNQGRSAWQINAGVKLYDFLAYGSGFPKSRRVSVDEVRERIPNIDTTNMVCAFSFYDAQMDDFTLGQWVISQYQSLGGELKIQKIQSFEELSSFDRIINATGPWVMQLRKTQKGMPAYSIDWVRGSHIFIDRPVRQALMLQIPQEKRIFFVLPYQGKTMIGTTEVRQDHPSCDGISDEERAYLVNAYNTYHLDKIQLSNIHQEFSGVRPLIKSANNPSNATREWAFERVENVLHVYGGKWTTSQIQGEESANQILS